MANELTSTEITGTLSTTGNATVGGLLNVGSSGATSRYMDIYAANGQRRGVRFLDGSDFRWIIEQAANGNLIFMRYTGGGGGSYQDTPITIDTSTGDVTFTGTLNGDGSGLTGVTAGGSIDKADITGKTEVTGVSGDYLLLSDTSDSGNLKKVDVGDFLGALSSGDITGKTTVTAATGDYLIVTDASDGDALKKVNASDFLGSSGTVTSVAVSGSDGIEVDSGSPITTSGTIALGVDAATMRTTLNVADGADVSPVDSVNGSTGTVVLDADDIDDTSTTHKFATAAQLAKADYLTVTGAVDLDTMNSDVTTNNAKVSNATHTGDVTGSTALTIADEAVTNAKMADMAASTLKGRVGSTGAPQDLALLQVMTILDTPVAISSSSNATAWDSDNGRIFADTLTENTTVAASSGTPYDGQKVEFRFRQAAGPYTLAWNAQFTAGETFSDTIPAVSTTAGDEDRYLFEYNATDSKYQLIAHATS